MFSLSEVLSHEHARCVQAWEKGAPKAQSVHQARTSWASMLPTWAKYVESDFLGALSYRTGRQRVGWIDDADFWQSFWRARASSKAVNESAESQRMHMQAYVEGAAAAGSLSFFTTAPTEHMELILGALSNTGVLVAPGVLDWCEENAQSRKNNVAFQQMFFLQRLDWSRYALSRVEEGRGELEWEETIALFRDASSRHSLGTHTTVNMLGHIMVTLAKTVEPARVLACMERAFEGALKPNVVLPLVALCSGYNVGSTPKAKALAEAGAWLHAVHDGRDEKPPEMLAILRTLEPVENPYALYCAALALGLHLDVAAEPGIDGQVFAAPEPGG